MSTTELTQAQTGSVLLKALFNTSDEIGLNSPELSEALGVELAGFHEIKTKELLRSIEKRARARCLILVSPEKCHFSQIVTKSGCEHSNSRRTGGIPAKQVTTLDGLMRIERCVDAMRG